MKTLYSADWVLPMSSPPIARGGIVISDDRILAVGETKQLRQQFPDAAAQEFSPAVILPGLINAHSHLELTAMRGLLDPVENNFLAWLGRLTKARLERMSQADLQSSAAWGACEAVRAGITFVADSSDSADRCMTSVNEVGLRGTIYQESFGPNPALAQQNFAELVEKIARLRDLETPLVRAGISPHAPYTVCARQLEMTAQFAISENLPVMMHAAESIAEESLLREGRGPFAEGLARRGIEWRAPQLSTIQYLKRHGILETKPLLAHCIHVNAEDLQTIIQAAAGIAHCPKSNAKLGHGRAPFGEFLRQNVNVGLGTDSVASNNTCDILEEARFALLISRTVTSPAQPMITADDVLKAATVEGARVVGRANEIGELRPGLQADVTIVSLANAHQLPSYDVANTLVFCSSGRDVVLTVVAGKEVYAGGHVTTVDEERLRARMREIQVQLETI